MSNKFVTNEIVKRSSGVIYDSGRTLIASIDKKEISDAVNNNSKTISKKDIIDSVKHNVQVMEPKKNSINVKWEKEREVSTDSLNILLKELKTLEEQSNEVQTVNKKINKTSNSSKLPANIKKKLSTTKKNSSTILSYHIIIASFAINDTQNANKFLNNIINQGYDAHMITSKRNRIAIKSFATLKEANKNKIIISTTTKFKDCWVFKYDSSKNT